MIDVSPIRLNEEGMDFSSQAGEYRRGNAVGGSLSTIENHLRPFQGEGGFRYAKEIVFIIDY